MNLKIVNNTNENLSEVQELVNRFFPYAQKRLGFDQPVTLSFVSDHGNAANPLGKTAYYDPNNNQIAIYTDKRHPKDMLRSFSHELVHHNQNCKGNFDGDHVTEEGYAQKDKHLRNLELEAYTKGNIILRDWEDGLKESRKKTMKTSTLKNLIREAINNQLEEAHASGLTVQGHDTTKCDEVHSGKSHDEWAQETRLAEQSAKPDFLDLDKDGDKEEPMKDAAGGDDEETVDEAHCGKRDDEDTIEERRRRGERAKDVPEDRRDPLAEVEDDAEGEDVIEEEEELEERRRANSEDRRGNNKPVDRQKPLEEKKTFEQLKEERLYNFLMNKWCN
tara:strand:- start:136 stop:1134 length:999 start_codon:yes stop_codon:yes gene_type:complete